MKAMSLRFYEEDLRIKVLQKCLKQGTSIQEVVTQYLKEWVKQK